MKRLLGIFLMLVLLSAGYAIECITADGRTISADSREYHFRYHASTQDYYFFGSNRWAVHYVFADNYPGMANASFEIQGARLWLPNPSETLEIELMTDLDGVPGASIRTASATLTESLVDIYFEQPYSATSIWLMVDYTTSVANRWVAASLGDGSHSYYMQEVGDVMVLSSFAQSGFNSELLFGLLGEFQHQQPELELCSFDLEGDISPSQRVHPSFSVYNHSSQTMDSANLNLLFSKPGEPGFDSMDIPIQQSIPPHSLVEIPADTAWLEPWDLPDDPMQIRVEATLSSNMAENDTLLSNNEITKYFSSFSHEMPIALVESFLRQDETGVITSIQDGYLGPETHNLLYYPNLSDSLANLAAMRRFNWYGFNSVPITIGLGYSIITGFREDYSSLFQMLATELEDPRSFVSSSTCNPRAQEGSENIVVDIELHNQDTLLYGSSAQNLAANSELFVALARKHELFGETRYVLDRFVCFADTINTAFPIGSSIIKSYNFTISGITSGELVANYRLYYWLQDEAPGRIHYVSYCDFEPETFVSNSDATAPRPQLSIGPNPLLRDTVLRITQDGKSGGKLSIYNLKGQLILKQDDFKGELRLPSSVFPSSGIYLIRFSDAMGLQQNRKISIIK